MVDSAVPEDVQSNTENFNEDDRRRFARVEEVLGFTFPRYELLRVALTHSSAKTDTCPSNERMEFLGDAVLGMIVSEKLYREYPEYPEGELTRIKSAAVSRATLADRARELGMAEMMYLGKGVKRDRGSRLPVSILANLYEAVLCALYLEAGLEEARRFVETDLGPVISSIVSHQFQQNYKSALQHLVQSRQGKAPVYKVVAEEGPDHQKEFHVKVVINGVTYGPGIGRNKKEAEQRAAKSALTELLKEFSLEDEEDDLLEIPLDDEDDE